MEKPLSPPRKLLVALVVVLLLYAGQIGSWTHPFNRYHRVWEFNDALAIILGVCVVAVAAALAAVAIDATGSARMRCFGHLLFLLALTAGVASGIGFVVGIGDPVARRDPVFVAIWLGVLAAIWKWRETLVTRCVAFCLVMSPLAPILFLQMLLWPSWQKELPPRSQGVASDLRRNEPACPIYFFVFDEWSYLRSTDEEGFLPDFPNLRKLAAQSIFFSEACSPGDCTKISLPRLMFQQEGLLLPRGGKSYWQYAGRELPTERVPSLFRLARSHGYRTAVLGFYHPYASIFGNQLDYCRTYPHDPKADSLVDRAVELGLYNFRFQTDPLSRIGWRIAYRRNFSRHWYEINQHIRAEAEGIIDTWPENTLVFFHWPLPHAPFIFNEDGSYRGPFPSERMLGTVEDYHRQLKCLDRLVGGLMSRLRANGKFDQAMIIVTSDHSWHRDPDVRAQSDAIRRVPLLIKLPGQGEGKLCRDRFETTELRPLIRSVLSSRGDRQQAARLVQETLRTAPADTSLIATPKPGLNHRMR